jgi:hypothetical protein
MNYVGRKFRADHIFELLAGQVDHVNLHPLGAASPSHAIDAANLVAIHQPLSEQSALAT